MPYVLITALQQDGELPRARYEPQGYQAKSGEVVLGDAEYESKQFYVWDAATQSLRSPTDADRLRWAKRDRIRAIRDALNSWYLQDVRSVEGDVTVYKKATGAVLTAEETSIFNTVNANYTKRNTAIASVNAATTAAQADAIATPVWDRVT